MPVFAQTAAVAITKTSRDLSTASSALLDTTALKLSNPCLLSVLLIPIQLEVQLLVVNHAVVGSTHQKDHDGAMCAPEIVNVALKESRSAKLRLQLLFPIIHLPYPLPTVNL